MIELQVYTQSGQEAGTVQLNPESLGGRVHKKLLKQAADMYMANLRQGTVCTKQRSDVAGSTRKLYPQKHTGNARAGMIRTPSRRGGGRAFGPKPRDFGWQMPKKARQLATRSAILSKFQDRQVKVVDSFAFEAVKTKQVAALLAALKLKGTCLFVSADYNKNLVLSARNLPNATVSVAAELNALDVLRCRWLVVEKAAVERMSTGAAS
jgi:large subunit ribosomal protein L4